MSKKWDTLYKSNPIRPPLSLSTVDDSGGGGAGADRPLVAITPGVNIRTVGLQIGRPNNPYISDQSGKRTCSARSTSCSWGGMFLRHSSSSCLPGEASLNMYECVIFANFSSVSDHIYFGGPK